MSPDEARKALRTLAEIARQPPHRGPVRASLRIEWNNLSTRQQHCLRDLGRNHGQRQLPDWARELPKPWTKATVSSLVRRGLARRATGVHSGTVFLTTRGRAMLGISRASS